jgi:hypothetical protein
MLATTRNPNRTQHALAVLAHQPGLVVLMLLPVGIATMLVIDWMLGAGAEYYNATHWLEAVTNLISGGSVADGPVFIFNQSDLGNVAALTIGAALLVLEPAVALVIIIYPASLLARRRRSHHTNGGTQ